MATALDPVPRRRLLKSLVRGAIAIGAAGLLPGSLLRLASATGPHDPQHIGEGKRLRRWAMIIDLRRCDGCQSVGKPPQCTEACILAHFAPEPMEWIQVFEKPVIEAHIEAHTEEEGTRFVPAPCMQCQNAPCVNVCPVGATFSTPEGMVVIDQTRCIGCRICMVACPYERRFFNWGDPVIPPEAEILKYDIDMQSPAIRGTVMKCNFCPHLARAGRMPYCAQACPNHAIYFGDLEEDIATNGVDVVTLSRFLETNGGYRLKEELGTEPRVFYVAGHGEAVGRDPKRTGRLPAVWPWKKKRKKAA